MVDPRFPVACLPRLGQRDRLYVQHAHAGNVEGLHAARAVEVLGE
jgi:hypothetical protein